MNILLITTIFLLLNVLNVLAEDYFIAIKDDSDGVESVSPGEQRSATFFLSEEFDAAAKDSGRSSNPVNSLNINLEGGELNEPVLITSISEGDIAYDKIKNYYTVSYTIPNDIGDGTYYLSINGEAFNGNGIIGSSQNFNIGEVDTSKFKILSPLGNSIWMTGSKNHTVVFTVPNTAGKANRFGMRLVRVDVDNDHDGQLDSEKTYYPIMDGKQADDVNPEMALLDAEGRLCHVKNSYFIVWSPIPKVPTGRYQLELSGYQNDVAMTSDTAAGAAYSGISDIFSLVSSEDWGGVVKDSANTHFSTNFVYVWAVIVAVMLTLNLYY